MSTSRRNFLSLSTLGLTAIGSTLGALAPKRATASPHATPARPDAPSAELEDFVYDIENGSKGWLGEGGSAKEATVDEFPVSQSIAGVSMRLKPGAFREL